MQKGSGKRWRFVYVLLWEKRSPLGGGAKKQDCLAFIEYYYLDLSRRTKAAYFVLERREGLDIQRSGLRDTIKQVVQKKNFGLSLDHYGIAVTIE